MEFRILGPLEISDGKRPIDLVAAKPRALLAVLLLDANRVVSRDRLLESLWGEHPPETAVKALQVYVSQLRKALGRDRIVTHAFGYELRVEPGELDVERAEALMSQGDFASASRVWRGSPLADFAYEPFAQSEIARLGELELECLESRIAADLANGRPAAVVGELEGLVRAHPLREELRAQLMLALYRAGRQADALDVYQAGRALLSDELGLEPGAKLRDLQRRILAHDPALGAAVGVPTTESAEPVSASGSPPRREARKVVTVLSCAIVTPGRELDPESLRGVIERGYDELLPLLEGHGATVERSLGGSVAAIFGVPAIHEDDALRAVRAASAIRDRFAELNAQPTARWATRLEVRIGIGTGDVFVGGDEDRLATGVPVQTALELQQAAGANEVLMDERTYRLVRSFVEAEPVGDHVRLLGAVPSMPSPTSRYDAAMVGRTRERRRLEDAFAQALGDRSCQLFTILGAPGVGKSRLVREFVGNVGEAALVAQGRCLPYGEGITYWPVREVVWQAAALDDSAGSDANLASLTSLLAEVDDAGRIAERIGEIVGLSDRVSGVDEIALAVGSLVEALARRCPLVVVFDDIHWGEPTFLDLVDGLAARAGEAPLLLVCVARPELLDVRPQWGGGKLNSTTISLEPLSEIESIELLEGLTGDADLTRDARNRIVEAAGGNPFFVEELVALLLEDPGRVGLELGIPPTIHALLAARLDRLPDDERVVLEAASVEGKVFHAASVGALVETNVDTPRALTALAGRGLVRSDPGVFAGERGYRFRHLLIRDAAYESIPKLVRAALHEAHAGWLETNVGERAIELDEIVGYHYEQAYRYRTEVGPLDEPTRELGRAAAARLGDAARRALVRSDAPAGVNLISRSVALLAADDPLRVELVPNVRVIQGLSDLRWAERVLTEAVEAAATTGDRALAAHALVQRGFLRLFSDEHVTPRELFDVSDRAITAFEDLHDELGLARAWRLASQAHYLDARPGLCADASERALVHARRAGDRFEEREIIEWLVIVLLLGPASASAATIRLEELLDESSELVEVGAQIKAGLATVAAMQGDYGRARGLIEESKSIMDDLAQLIWIVTFWWGFVHLWGGDLDSAEAEARPAYDALKRIGEKSHFSSIAHLLAAVAYAREELEETERLTHECEEASRANDVHSQIMWRATRAKVFARRGDLDAAEALARDAVALAETGDFLLAHADATADLGEVLALAAKTEEARLTYERAADLYTAKGVVRAASGVRARIEELRSA